MFNIKQFKSSQDHLADLLPWAALIAPGVVLNKEGSLQRSLQFRGPDLGSATDTQLVVLTSRVNNLLKRLGSGWVLYLEAVREPYQFNTEAQHFTDPVSCLIDAEREKQFSRDNYYYESHYILTLQYKAPLAAISFWQKWFLKSSDTIISDEAKNLAHFVSETERFLSMAQDVFFEATFLEDEATLTYLHSTISTKKHRVTPPETPMYLDAFLADTPLIGGLSPRLGEQHLGVVSVLSFPASTLPALLDQLNHLALPYRWMTRFMPLDKPEAEKTLKQCRQRWFAKRKGFLNLLQEVFTKTESQLTDTHAIAQAQDADAALQALGSDQVAFGYYTTTVVVTAPTTEALQSHVQAVERIINGLGFTSIHETYNAVEAWLSSLPGQAYANVRKTLLHTLNLAHLMPLSASWPGPMKDAHLNAPPLMTVQTQGSTPFRWANHVGDVGHTFVVGPTGAGKSVLLNMMAMQFLRYKNARVIFFDKGGSALASTQGVGGVHVSVGDPSATLAFQPLSDVDKPQTRLWAQDWLLTLLSLENVAIVPQHKQDITQALQSLASMPVAHRTFTALCALLQDETLKQAFSTYTASGSEGTLFDAAEEHFSTARWQCFEMEHLMSTPKRVAPVLSYLFHRLNQQFTGEPTLLILDEAWLFLDNPVFSQQIKDWLKTLRKYNVSVVFATQSVDDALNTTIASTLIEACPTRILLPNDRILEPNVRAAYDKLGLNDKECQLIAEAIPKSQYYYQSREGSRLFELVLGPLAMAFCAATDKRSQQVTTACAQAADQNRFLQQYLKAHQLEWVWKSIESSQRENIA